jgi:phosphoglycerate dehydrogenase-like enzyme
MSLPSSRPTVVIPDDISSSFARFEGLGRLRAVAEVVIHEAPATNEGELSERVRDADAILSFRPAFTKFPATVIRACPRLRLIAISGTGVEDVDVAEATVRGIAVCNVVGSSNRAVAEHCLALMMDRARHVSRLDRDLRGGAWQSRQGLELAGKTLGLIGLGAIAKQVAGIGRALGMQVLSWSRNNDPQRAEAAGAQAVDLDVLLARSEVISLHLRLGPDTAGLIGAEQFAMMKPGAILINTARAGLVDEKALISALSTGRLGGAGLDVFEATPLPRDHPFLSMDSIVLTPVTAWNTTEASSRMIGATIDNAVGFFSATPLNIVNPDFRNTLNQANAGDVAEVTVEGSGTVRSPAVSPS